MANSRRKLVLLNPSKRAGNALAALGDQIECDIIKDERSKGSFLSNADFGSKLDIIDLIEKSVEEYGAEKIDGITSTVAFPGMNIAAACIAERLGLPGPSPQALLTCEHKYYCRLAQRKFVPEATADFQLLDPGVPDVERTITDFPKFIKPVKSILSSGAFAANNADELREGISRESLPREFLKPFNELIEKYSTFEYNADYLLVEELLQGWQVSLEGFVYNGEITIMGIVDAVMFPGTISFKRFQYPSLLSDVVQNRMKDIASRFISGIKYDNWAFNLELMYNPLDERIHIIEVNARLASQFWDLFEKVDGSNPFDAVLKIALGEKPSFEHRKGKFKVAASCVLRTFEDQLVTQVPDESDIAKLNSKYPDAIVEILAKAGRRLSASIQDAGSFRFGLVNIGADSHEELQAKFEDCVSMLPYQFAESSEIDHSFESHEIAGEIV